MQHNIIFGCPKVSIIFFTSTHSSFFSWMVDAPDILSLRSASLISCQYSYQDHINAYHDANKNGQMPILYRLYNTEEYSGQNAVKHVYVILHYLPGWFWVSEYVVHSPHFGQNRSKAERVT